MDFLGQGKLLRLWLLLAVSFVGLALSTNLITIAYFGKPANWYNALIQPLTYFLWILFVPVVFALFRRVPYKGQNSAFFLKHLAMGQCVCLLHRALVELGMVVSLSELDPPLGTRLNPLNNPSLFGVRVFTGAMNNLFLYVITLALVVLFWFEARFRDEAILRVRAEKDKVHAQLQALKMQVQPHFLFNAFNGLATLMEEDVEEAQDYLGRLGELLHHALDHQAEDMVTIAEETDFAENYLAIQAVRFSDRMTVEMDVSEAVLHRKAPAFVLQPLIENTIVHGVALSARPHQIHVQIQPLDRVMSIEVVNTCDSPFESADSSGHGLGLSGLRDRLKLLYGTDFVMETQRLDHGFRVYLELPEAVNE